MLIFKLAIRNLLRHTRKTVLLAAIIILGTAMLFFANAVFQRTNKGLESSFVKSLTGNAVLSANSEVSYSLFGNEIPIVSSYEAIPAIADYSSMIEVFPSIEYISDWTPIVSAAAYVEIDEKRTGAVLFGVDYNSYFSVCPDIIIEEGSVSSIKNGGVFLNRKIAEMIEDKIDRPLKIGDPLQLSMFSDGSFRIVKGFLAGIHSYVGTSQVLDRIVLADPDSVRRIANYTMGYVLDNGNSSDQPKEETFDLDSLFSNAEDVTIEEKNGFSIDDVEKLLAQTEEGNTVVMPNSAAWSFVLFRSDENPKALVNFLEKEIKNRKWDIRVLDWRQAAGLSAQTVFALQFSFYIGMVFIAIGAVLVIMNALLISVFERSSEIGTMRGIGAGKDFIRKLFISESMLLTISASFLGILLGIIICLLVSVNGIAIKNELFINLFGGETIRPVITLSGIAINIIMAFIVGALAWIYPVSIAMHISPVSVMGKE